MISKEELEKWLQTLPEDDGISIADLLAYLGEHHAVKGAERKAEQINDLLRAQAGARARIGLYDA